MIFKNPKLSLSLHYSTGNRPVPGLARGDPRRSRSGNGLVTKRSRSGPGTKNVKTGNQNWYFWYRVSLTANRCGTEGGTNRSLTANREGRRYQKYQKYQNWYRRRDVPLFAHSEAVEAAHSLSLKSSFRSRALCTPRSMLDTVLKV